MVTTLTCLPRDTINNWQESISYVLNICKLANSQNFINTSQIHDYMNDMNIHLLNINLNERFPKEKLELKTKDTVGD